MEQVGLCVLDDPEDGEVDINDVLVAGQHQRFFRQFAAAGAAAFAGAVADLGAVDPGDARPQHALDRCRQMVVEARRGLQQVARLLGPVKFVGFRSMQEVVLFGALFDRALDRLFFRERTTR